MERCYQLYTVMVDTINIIIIINMKVYSCFLRLKKLPVWILGCHTRIIQNIWSKMFQFNKEFKHILNFKYED